MSAPRRLYAERNCCSISSREVPPRIRPIKLPKVVAAWPVTALIAPRAARDRYGRLASNPSHIALDHTHHDKRTAVDSERPAERVCSSTKPGPPEALADHRQVLGPVVGLVIAEESPDPCADAERAEQLAADELGVFEGRISAGRDGDRDGLGLTIRRYRARCRFAIAGKAAVLPYLDVERFGD